MQHTRIEKDSMGEMPVPADALWGASTARAVRNFPVSGQPLPTELLRAFGLLKAACARANLELGLLDGERSRLIIAAAEEIMRGEHDDQFPVDVFQTGSGTSTNMNVNEVIANRAAQLAGVPIGRKEPVHPNDHVNFGQSSNDTFPTALALAAVRGARERLLPALVALESRLAHKARQFDDIIKIGRTHLADATPIRLGQEFSGYAAQVRLGRERLEPALNDLSSLAIGGTAVGTGINTHPDFAGRVCEQLSRATGIVFREADNHFERQATQDAVVALSGQLRTVAVSLSKVANDVRWLGSGPRCGLGELKLPAIQPGSSIMPGKVNPVICESVMQVCCQVIGNDAAIAAGGLGGVGSLLELNVAMPMMARNLLESIHLLGSGATVLREKLLDGLEADPERCAALVEQSLAMCTRLAPVIGYDRAAAIAHRAHSEGRSVRAVAAEDAGLPAGELDALLDALAMTGPGV